MAEAITNDALGGVDTSQSQNAVMYVEPNYSTKTASFTTNFWNGQDLAYPDPENYCVAVDLLAEVPNRSMDGSTTQGSDVIALHAETMKDGKITTSVSFLRGTTIGDKNYFTTAPYEFTTFKDINRTTNFNADGSYTDNSYVNSEMFGIESIDINYDTFQSPTIQINFVDIRGISLFSAEDLAHQGVNGTMRSIDTKDTAGSFFKCLFKQPYPKFTLYLKGFYGDPVAYELNCNGFKASFDCETGNFRATANFVGYAFSLLTDVDVASLIVSPCDTCYGKEYWEQQKTGGAFRMEDGTDMITLVELVGKINEIKASLATIQGNAKSAATQNQQEQQANDSVGDAIDSAVSTFKGGASDIGGKVVNSGSNGRVIIAVKCNDSGVPVKEDKAEEFVKKVEEKTKAIKDAAKESGIEDVEIVCTESHWYTSKLPNLESMAKTLDLDKDAVNGIKTELGSDADSYGFIYFDGDATRKKVEAKKGTLSEEADKIKEDLAKQEEDLFKDALGFQPTIGNLVHILFAHLDTYLHCVQATANKVGDTSRTLSDLKLDEGTDLNVSSEGQVPPFPRVYRKKTEKGKTMIVDDWIGNLGVDSGVAPEIDFVNGMLNAVNEVAQVFETINSGGTPNSGSTESDESTQRVANVSNPSSPVDFASTSSWVTRCDTNNMGELSEIATLRAFSTLGANSSAFDSKQAEKMGEMDAESFISRISHPSTAFTQAFANGTVSGQTIIDAVTNEKDTLKSNGTWPWTKITGSKELVKKNSDGSYSLTDYFNKSVNKDGVTYKYSRIPFQNIDCATDPKDENCIFTTYNGNENGKCTALKVDTRYKAFKTNYESLKAMDGKLADGTSFADASKELFPYLEFSGKKYIQSFCTSSSQTPKIFCKKISIAFGAGYDKDATGTLVKQSVTGKTSFTKDIPINGKGIFNSDYTINSVKYMSAEQKKEDCKYEYVNVFSNPEVFEDSGKWDELTIDHFNGFYCDGKSAPSISQQYCLFGERRYYANSEIPGARCLFFLSTLQFDFANTIRTVAKFLTSTVKLKSDSSSFDYNAPGNYVPYSAILLIGGLLKYWNDLGNATFDEAKVDGAGFAKLCHDSEIKKLDTLRKDVKLYLISLFDKFVESDFKTIENELALHDASGNLLTVAQMDTLLSAFRKTNATWDSICSSIGSSTSFSIKSHTTLEETLANSLSKEFLNNYYCLFLANNSLILVHRHSSEAASNVCKLMLQPCMVIKTVENETDTITVSKGVTKTTPSGKKAAKAQVAAQNASSGTKTVDKTASISKDNLNSYMNGFTKGIKNKCTGSTGDSDSSSAGGDPSSVSSEGLEEVIQISYYKYVKSLYDKWLSNYSGGENGVYEVFSLAGAKSFFKNNVHFIDAYYNNISQDVILDISKFVDLIIKCTSMKEGKMDFLSFLSTIMGDNSFHIQMVQNFLDLTGSEESSRSKLYRMFDPLPASEIDWDRDTNKYPDIVFLYNYDPSSKLNFGDDEEFGGGDSFDISGKSHDLPYAISSKDVSSVDKGYKIPAFGVTYGMGNQSYYTNIEINMDNPITTEAAIQAQYNIAAAAVDHGTNEANAENGKNVTFLGQDLFTIYSNYSYTCTVTMLGCAYIQPLMYFQLNNIPLFNGAYIIYKASHSIRPGTMVTTFSGNRICNVASPKVSKTIVPKVPALKSEGSGGDGSGGETEDPGLHASINNNCAYKYFSPDGGGGGIGPNLSSEIRKKVKDFPYGGIGTKDNQDANPNITIADLLCITICCECGNHDELTCQLHATVLYNSYFEKGKKWNYLGHSDTATHHYGASSFDTWPGKSKPPSSEKKAKIRKVINDIFTKSPGILVGKMTTVLTPIMMYDAGKKLGMSKSEKITLDAVQRMRQYCCGKYFMCKNPRKPIPFKKVGNGCWAAPGGEYSDYFTEYRACEKEPNFRIHKNKWCCQHEGGTGIDDCVVYCGPQKPLWTAQPTTPPAKKSNKVPSESAEGLYNAIIQTCNFSDAISLSGFKMEKYSGNKDGFFISCTPASGMAQIFDIVVQTYSEATTVYWCVEGDASGFPSKIYVGQGGKSRKIAVAKHGSGDNYNVVQLSATYTGAHALFYTALKKKYGTITSSNIKSFIAECPNFGTKTDKAAIDAINKVLDKTVESCNVGGPTGGGSPEASGFIPNYSGFNAKAAADEAQVGKWTYRSGLTKGDPGKASFGGKSLGVKDGRIYEDAYYGRCTTSVGHFLDVGLKAAGGKGWQGKCGVGWEMNTRLPPNGFECITTEGQVNTKSKMNSWTKANARMGDVCVMTHGAASWGTSKGHEGHACMFNGQYWVSDTVQKSSGALCYGEGPYLHVGVYRFKNVKK